MALYKLDADGKPIKPGSRKQPVTNDKGQFHWRYQVSKSNKYPKNMLRHFWAYEEDVHAIVKAFWEGKPIERALGAKWKDAFNAWQDGHPLASPGHIESLDRNIRYLCEFFKNEDLTIEETTKGMFQQWLNERAKVGLSAANKSQEVTAIARYAYEKLDMVSEPPQCLVVKKFKVQEKEKRAIPVERIGDYLTASEKHFGVCLELIAEFIVFTGVRSTEAAQLNEDNISQTITVFQKAKGAGKRPANVVHDEYIKDIIKRAKKHKADFINECKKVISESEADYERFTNDHNRRRRALAKIDKMKRCIQNAKGKHIFINRAGSPWEHNAIRKAWKKSCDKAGLEYFVPHELRHTHATIAGGAGFSERFIQAAMRWDDPKMAKRYVHETDNMAKEVAAAVRGELAKHLGRVEAEEKPATLEVKIKGLGVTINISCPHCHESITISPE